VFCPREWRWSEPGWQLPSLGDIDVLSEDRVLVTMARMGRAAHTELVEVDVPTGAVASRQVFEENGRGYRAERLDACALFDRVDLCPSLSVRREKLDAAFPAP